MGAFRYCIHCDSPLPKPDPLEDLLESQICRFCKKSQPNLFSREEWIIEAFEEIKELKNQIRKSNNNGFAKLSKRIKRLSIQNRKLKARIDELETQLERNFII